MSNSPLICYKHISPHRNSPRNHTIDTVSIHCMAGNVSIESCGKIFQSSEASSNYGIGSDGRIALYVDEGDRSWCTSSASNDNRAITIEVANNGGEPDWPVTTRAYESLILLLTDICQRNNIKQLLWQGNKNLIGQVNKQNMTVHRWFAQKSCPGNYLYNLHYDIANRVNANLAPKIEEEEDMDGETIFNRLTEYLTSLPTSDFAWESSQKGVASGIFSDGDTDGLVDDPKGLLTREQLAVILNRLKLLG